MTKELILILDFGSPYTQLLAQKIRENHVFSRVVAHNISVKEIELQKPKGIILSGCAESVYSKKDLLPEKGIFKLNIPILGICYGARVIVQHFGGRVKSDKSLKSDRCELFIDNSRNLFWQMPGNITCWMNYADCVKRLPSNFKASAHTQENPFSAFECVSKKIYGVSFQPEAVATQRGSQIVGNFLYKICGCLGTWTMKLFIRETVASIRKTVGKSKVILSLNSSLNSFVLAILVNRAIGKRLKCIFIDNGLLRLNEAKQIKKILNSNFHLNLNFIDKSQRFLQGLKGVQDCDDKKGIIRNISAELFQGVLKKSKGTQYLAQETLYSDVINSGPVTDKPLKLKLLEPLCNLFKDEIRVIAKEFDLPDTLIFRQPFPQNGLAGRIIGEVTASRLNLLREADACVVEEIKAADIYEQIWQSFAVLILPKNVIAIRCVASISGTTADWVRLPYDVLEKIALRITRKVKGVNRVVYDISSKPPTAIEWE
ncbi:MAG: glutamine-hydrolyzing GMP synthase [Candidatus Omnitrophota bacterium]